MGNRQRLVAAASAIVVAVGLVAPYPPVAVSSSALAGGPSVSQPSVHLNSYRALGRRTVPLTVSWPVATPGDAPVARYELELSRDSGSWMPIDLATPLSRSVTTQQPAWAVLVFRVRAVDQDGIAGDWTASLPAWLQTAQESDRDVVLSPGWQIVKGRAAIGGWHATTTSSGESATFTFRGREVGYIARLGPSRGKVGVSLDGLDPATVDLHRRSPSSRRMAFSAVFPANGEHSLSVTALTEGAVTDLDAFVVLADPAGATLVGAGDIASCTSTADSDTAAVAAGVPGIVFTAGDNVYPVGTLQNFTDCYEPSWGILKSRTLPVPGNHEYLNNPGAKGYFGYFGSAAGEPGKGWYKYDAGTWRVYALNSECNLTTCPQQLDWLAANLVAEPHACTLAIWHRPRWGPQSHTDWPRMDDVWRLLATSGADFVVNGHNHMYARYAPLDANGQMDASGMRIFVVGTGGSGLFNYDVVNDLIELHEDTTHGVLRLDLSPGGYSWQFMPAGSGTFSDSGSSSCH